MLGYSLTAVLISLAMMQHAFTEGSSLRSVRSATKNTCNCGQAVRTTRIVGGEETEVNEFPWQVAMFFELFFACGGSLISDRWVLSAAHCIVDPDVTKYLLVLGDHDLTINTETAELAMGVEKIIVHKKYENNKQFNNDFALLKLDGVIDWSMYPNIRPVCLPSDSGLFGGATATVSGWGATATANVSPQLQKVDVKVLLNKQCKNDYGYAPADISKKMICAAVPEGGKDACQGDSGGPLVTADESNNYLLIGVVSWGEGCADANYPGVYARVTTALRWITKKTTGSFSTCPKV